MSTQDPIVSATVAQLYLAQGHLDRAATVVDRVLAERPHDGQALVLRERIGARSQACLGCELGSDTIVLRWQAVSEPGEVHLVFVAYLGPGHPVRVRVTSRRCHTAFGDWHCRKPAQPGTAIACLARLLPRELEILAVAPNCTWE